MEESKMVLRTEDLVKKYGKRTVVSHVSINVKQGEIVGLLGNPFLHILSIYFWFRNGCLFLGVNFFPFSYR